MQIWKYSLTHALGMCFTFAIYQKDAGFKKWNSYESVHLNPGNQILWPLLIGFLPD